MQYANKVLNEHNYLIIVMISSAYSAKANDI